MCTSECSYLDLFVKFIFVSLYLLKINKNLCSFCFFFLFLRSPGSVGCMLSTTVSRFTQSEPTVAERKQDFMPAGHHKFVSFDIHFITKYDVVVITIVVVVSFYIFFFNIETLLHFINKIHALLLIICRAFMRKELHVCAVCVCTKNSINKNVRTYADDFRRRLLYVTRPRIHFVWAMV